MGGGSALLLNSQDGSTRPLLAEQQQTSLLLSGPVLTHRTHGPARPAPGSSLLPAQSSQAPHGSSLGRQPSPSRALSERTHRPHTHTRRGWPAGHSPLVADLMGTRLSQGCSLWVSHARPSQLSEAPSPQSPAPSLDGPPGQHGNSSGCFWGLRRPSLLEGRPSMTACWLRPWAQGPL